jgi:hypothetical protein
MSRIALALFLAASVTFSSCSTAPKTPRQQRAYEKYLKQRAAERDKQQQKIREKQKEVPPPPPASPPVESVSLESPGQ